MQGYNPENPLIVQADRSMFLEVHSPYFEAARAAIAPFAELEKSPEHIHTYRITPLSLWNAASSGFMKARPDLLLGWDPSELLCSNTVFLIFVTFIKMT